MSKSRRLSVAVLFFVVLLSSAAWAREPYEALSSRPEGSVYATLRVDDLGGMLKNVFSPENVEMFTSLMAPGEAQAFGVFASMASQLPVKSIAWIAGSTADNVPFLQLAASMPKNLQPKLDLVAAGKASPEDLITLLLGDGGLLLAAAIKPVVQDGEKGPYYTIDGQVVLSARDDLLLMTLSSADLRDSLGALDVAEKRLDRRNKFDSSNFYTLHLDMKTVAALSSQENSGEVDLNALLKLFKAPLNIETAFDSKPESFLISSWANILDSLTMSERFKDVKPIAGSNEFFVGEGKLLYAFTAVSHFSVDDLKVSPEAVKIWEKIAKEMGKKGIAESDLENLLTGTFSLVGGGDATILGRRTPGVYLAFNGQKGAAKKILNKILEDEDFMKAVPVAPLKVEGWDTLVAVDPSLVPFPLLLGVKGETLFVGVIDSEGLNKKPELSPEAAKLLNGKFFVGGFFDAASIWNYLKQEAADDKSPLGLGLKTLPAETAALVRNIFDAELSISAVKLWVPTWETSFAEFSLVQVPAEKRLLPKIMKAAALSGLGNTDSASLDTESPLEILLTVKGALEEYMAATPGAKLDDQQEAFAGAVTFITTPEKEHYIGTQVTGDGVKLELAEQAKKFGLTGSAGLNIAPDGSPYDGQEVVWIKIEQ